MWQKDNIIRENREDSTKNEKKRQNIKLAIEYRLLKYVKKKKINEEGILFSVFNDIVNTKDIPKLKKCINNNGIYKKILGKDIFIIKTWDNFKEIEKRFTEIAKNNSLKAYVDYSRTNKEYDKKIILISNNLPISNDDLNFKGISGLKKMRTDIYAINHKLVGNTPSVIGSGTILLNR